MNDEVGLFVFTGATLGSLTCIAVDVFFHPCWWIIVPSFVVLVLAMVYGLTR